MSVKINFQCSTCIHVKFPTSICHIQDLPIISVAQAPGLGHALILRYNTVYKKVNIYALNMYTSTNWIAHSGEETSLCSNHLLPQKVRRAYRFSVDTPYFWFDLQSPFIQGYMLVHYSSTVPSKVFRVKLDFLLPI